MRESCHTYEWATSYKHANIPSIIHRYTPHITSRSSSLLRAHNVTWLIHVRHHWFLCDVTHPYAPRLIHACLIINLHHTRRVHLFASRASCVHTTWHDPFTYDWFLCDVTHLYATRLIHACLIHRSTSPTLCICILESRLHCRRHCITPAL